MCQIGPLVTTSAPDPCRVRTAGERGGGGGGRGDIAELPAVPSQLFCESETFYTQFTGTQLFKGGVCSACVRMWMGRPRGKQHTGLALVPSLHKTPSFSLFFLVTLLHNEQL